MEKLSFSSTPRVLSEFESTCFESLKELQVEGWNLWQICKIPLFYTFIKEVKTGPMPSTPAPAQLSAKKLLLRTAVRSIRHYLPSRRVMIFAHTADKLSVNKEGRYYNAIIDPILDLNLLKRPVIVEQPGAQGFLTPARYPWHINQQLFQYAAAVLNIFQDKNADAYAGVCLQLTTLLNSFLEQQNYSDRAEHTQLCNAVRSFLREWRFFKKLFKWKKPPFIISSECMGRGMMAAAAEMDIPFIELQHGAIDRYYPPYVWDYRFAALDHVIKPRQVWVFGALAKEILVSGGFFKEAEVIPVGYKRIDEVRGRLEKSTAVQRKMLVVVQPMMHDFNLRLIECLLSLPPSGVEISFKVHPLQPAEEIAAYTDMISGSNIRTVDKSENIHSLIVESDLVIGHVTTCLEEALTLSTPSITVTTDDLPQGLHSMTGMDRLKDVIRPVSLSGLGALIDRFYKDAAYRESWIALVNNKRNDIYNTGYPGNVAEAFKKLQSQA